MAVATFLLLDFCDLQLKDAVTGLLAEDSLSLESLKCTKKAKVWLSILSLISRLYNYILVFCSVFIFYLVWGFSGVFVHNPQTIKNTVSVSYVRAVCSTVNQLLCC